MPFESRSVRNFKNLDRRKVILTNEICGLHPRLGVCGLKMFFLGKMGIYTAIELKKGGEPKEGTRQGHGSTFGNGFSREVLP